MAKNKKCGSADAKGEEEPTKKQEALLKRLGIVGIYSENIGKSKLIEIVESDKEIQEQIAQIRHE